MSKLFLFAVGGTGARVLRSFTMLIASGLQGFDSSTEIVPIIIDHDRQCGDKKGLRTHWIHTKILIGHCIPTETLYLMWIIFHDTSDSSFRSWSSTYSKSCW